MEKEQVKNKKNSLDKLTARQKANRIDKEIEELTSLCSNVPKNKKQLVDRIIRRAAFMSFTLDTLQEQINEKGAVELFENGTQKMLREHPASKIYNTMVKNYIVCMKTLSDLLPESNKEGNAIQEFMAQKQARRSNGMANKVRGSGTAGENNGVSAD